MAGGGRGRAKPRSNFRQEAPENEKVKAWIGERAPRQIIFGVASDDIVKIRIRARTFGVAWRAP